MLNLLTPVMKVSFDVGVARLEGSRTVRAGRPDWPRRSPARLSRPGSACRTHPPARRPAARCGGAAFPADVAKRPDSVWSSSNGTGVRPRSASISLASGRGVAWRCASGELAHGARVQLPGLLEVAAAEVQPHYRVTLRPAPTVVNCQAAEQLLAAFEQLFERVHEQALAEAARAGEEVVLAGVVHEPAGVEGLVHVVEAFLPDLTEGLDADRQAYSSRPRARPMPTGDHLAWAMRTVGLLSRRYPAVGRFPAARVTGLPVLSATAG